MGSIYDWSKTPGANGNADAQINWQEQQTPGSVNNSARQTLARIAEFRDDVGGLTAGGTVNVTGGVANAYTLTVNSGWTTFGAGRLVSCRLHAAATGASTINVNATGNKPLLTCEGLQLPPLPTGTMLLLLSDAAGWIALNVDIDPTAAEVVAASATIFRPGVAIITQGASATPAITAADNGTIYTIALGANNEVVPLPSPAALPNGWCIRLQTTGMGTGYQTARITAGTGTPFLLSGTAQAFCPLIGHGEILEFLVIGGVYHLSQVAPPNYCTSTRAWTGTGAWVALIGLSWTEVPFNNWVDANPINCRAVGNRIVLPVAGMWVLEHRRCCSNRVGSLPVHMSGGIGSSVANVGGYGAYVTEMLQPTAVAIREDSTKPLLLHAGTEVGSYLYSSESSASQLDYYNTYAQLSATLVSR
jgi:hypothetical protein